MLHSQKPNVFRFRQEVPPFTPLAVRSAGHYKLHPGSQLDPPIVKWFCEVFWSVKGSGTFKLGRDSMTVKAEQVFYLLPGEIHEIRPLCSGWEYYWFTLDHELASKLLEAFGFEERPFTTVQCPEDFFAKLTHAVQEGTLAGDRKASHWAHAIILEAIEQRGQTSHERPSHWVKECKQYIDDEFNNPKLNISEISDRLGIHRSTVFRAFKQSYQMTPSAYLQNRRLHRAIELLKQTNKPIQEIGMDVGMPDTNYLARLIKKVTGLPPLRFRESFRW